MRIACHKNYMKPHKLFGILLWAILLAPSDCAPSFNATPPGTSSYPVTLLEGEGDSSSVTLSWDYNADGETVEWVDLEFEFGLDNWRWSSVLVARKTVNQTLQIFRPWAYSGRITFSERATFTLSNITRNDTGRFTCRVSFTSHPPIFNSTEIVVVVPPTVIIRPPSPVELNEGDSTTLVCEACGFPYLSVTLMNRNGVWLRGYRRGLWGVRRCSLTLFINSANNKRHAGRYTCTAEVSSPGLSPISANYTIDVRVRFKPQVTLRNVTVDEGSDAYFYCNATAYPTPVTYSWLKNGKRIISDPSGDFESFGDGHSRLRVKHVTHNKSGGFLNGYYSCSATNVMGTGESELAFIRVNYPPQNVRVTGPAAVRVVLGEIIRLSCNADGYPYPTSYYWKLNGNVIDGGTLGTLVLSNIKANEAGNYTCGARNRLGFKESAIKMVVVEYQPTFTDFKAGTPGNSMMQGTTATLTCSADGYPAPTYTIRHGTKIVTQRSKTGRYVINNIQLNAEEESYFCVPSNKVGGGPEKELVITVQAAPTESGKVNGQKDNQQKAAFTESDKENDQKDNQQKESAGLSSSQMSGVIVGILILLAIILALFAYIVRGIKRTERSGMENGEHIPDRSALVNEGLEMAHGSYGTSDVAPQRNEVKA